MSHVYNNIIPSTGTVINQRVHKKPKKKKKINHKVMNDIVTMFHHNIR